MKRLILVLLTLALAGMASADSTIVSETVIPTTDGDTVTWYLVTYGDSLGIPDSVKQAFDIVQKGEVYSMVMWTYPEDPYALDPNEPSRQPRVTILAQRFDPIDAAGNRNGVVDAEDFRLIMDRADAMAIRAVLRSLLGVPEPSPSLGEASPTWVPERIPVTAGDIERLQKAGVGH